VKDLTGKQLVRLNGRPVAVQAPLAVNDRLSLSPSGPVFRFLGAGRLAEIEAPGAPAREPDSAPPPAAPAQEKPAAQAVKGESLLKKLFSR
jgi:hypothetical protein